MHSSRRDCSKTSGNFPVRDSRRHRVFILGALFTLQILIPISMPVLMGFFGTVVTPSYFGKIFVLRHHIGAVDGYYLPDAFGRL